MNPTVFAMRRPVTTIMLVVALISGGILAYSRMRVDIFPSLNVPKIYVFLDYIGMSPDQMEGFIVNQLELYFQYVDGIQDINTRNIQQVALTELSFYPGTDMGQAMAQVVAMSDRAMSWMPKGTLPPMIMRMDTGSVPVGYLVFESKVTSLGAMGDLAQNIIRPLVQKYVPGTVAISPFGPNMRSIIINVDPQRLLDYNVTPQQVIQALAAGNTIIPAGNVYVKDSMPVVANNATVVNPQELGNIPLKLESNVYLRDVATIKDDVDINYGYALVNGKKSVYLPIIKKDTGSTLTVVADVHKAMQMFRDAVPKDVSINFEFDESPTVVAAVESVATEGLIGAGLTGLMILVFLGDLRSVIVVVSNIPLALLGSLFGLWVTGNTINIMSLGGMALAIGILVDEATVTIENVHVQMGHTSNVPTAVLRASNATAVPRLLALLCILSVFIPAFIMGDPLRALFMPLTLGVGFAMISSYLLSSTFVPILCVALLNARGSRAWRREARAVRPVAQGLRQRRELVCPAALADRTELSRSVWTGPLGARDAGRYRAVPPDRLRPIRAAIPVPARFELRADAADRDQVSRGDRARSQAGKHRDHHGLRRPGPAELRHRQHGAVHARTRRRPVAGRAGRGQRDQACRVPRAAPQGPARAGDPLAGQAAGARGTAARGGGAAGQAVELRLRAGRHRDLGHELRVVNADRGAGRRHRPGDGAAARREDRCRHAADPVPSRHPVRPDARLPLGRGRDRPREGRAERCRGRGRGQGAHHGDRVDPLRQRSTTGSTSKTGFDYLVQLQVPPLRMEKPEDVETLPIESVNPLVNLMIRDVAMVRRGVRPGELDRDMSQRYLTLTANVEGEDMGRASRAGRPGDRRRRGTAPRRPGGDAWASSRR